MGLANIAGLIAMIKSQGEIPDVLFPLSVSNFSSDGSSLTQRDKKQLESWILRNERLPTDEDLKELGGWWEVASRRRNEEWLTDMSQRADEIIRSNPEIAEKVLTQQEVPDYYWDEAKLHQEGTKENDMFNFYQDMGNKQAEVGKTELARSERDMQIEMSQQRRQLVDEVRKRRTNQLRSGLSTAQIANEEIQMLLMGQQAQQQTAQNYFDQRGQLNQQQRMNPFEAELRAREGIKAGHQGTGAFYAGSTADAITAGKRYGNENSATQMYIDEVMQKDN